MTASLLIGSHTVALRAVGPAVLHFDAHDADQVVIRQVRIPRTAVGVIAGVALGAAGAMMQALTRNPLAEPGLLGVNSGAAAAVALTMAIVAGSSGTLAPGATVVPAMAGAAIAGVLVLALGGALAARPDPVRLVLAGAALSTVLGSVSASLVLTYPQVFSAFRFWDAGAVVHRPWGLIATATGLVALALLLAALAARSLDALALGDDMGRALGASPLKAWVLAGTASIILCGTATALVGPIGFVGLAAPLAARLIVGERQVLVLVLSALFAASLLLGSDIIGRVLIRPDEVQASVIAAAIGAPVFILVVRRTRLGALR